MKTGCKDKESEYISDDYLQTVLYNYKKALYKKVSYLSEIGCELSYFAYPKKSKFESVSILNSI
jgi:hypothetical protein